MIKKTPSGKWAVDFRDQHKRRTLRVFPTHKEAVAFNKQVMAEISRGEYVRHSPKTAADAILPLPAIFGPCVYVIKESGSDEFLYVGMSANGIGRLTPNHRAIVLAQNHNNVIVTLQFCADVQAAAALESQLILKHRPRYNSTVDIKFVDRSRRNKGLVETTAG